MMTPATDDRAVYLFRPNPGAQSQFIRSAARYPAMIAGQGSGKTTAGIAKLTAMAARWPGVNWLMLEPTYREVSQVALPAITRYLRAAGVPHEVNRSEMEVKLIPWGSTIFLHSANKPERITGFEVGGVWCDEPARYPAFGDPTRSWWFNISARLRDARVPEQWRQILATGTHEGEGTEFFKLWESPGAAERGFRLYRGATWENPSSREYGDRLLAIYGPELARQYLYGEAVGDGMAALCIDDIRAAQRGACPIAPDWHLLAKLPGSLYAGMDVGRSKSLTVIWLLHKAPGCVLRTVGVLELRSTAFVDQAAAIERLGALGAFRSMAIDATYNPQTAEDAVRLHGAHRVEPVVFTEHAKIELVDGIRDVYPPAAGDDPRG